MITWQAAKVASPDLSSSTAANELPFGFSGAYWLDVRGYDPVATVASLEPERCPELRRWQADRLSANPPAQPYSPSGARAECEPGTRTPHEWI